MRLIIEGEATARISVGGVCIGHKQRTTLKRCGVLIKIRLRNRHVRHVRHASVGAQ